MELGTMKKCQFIKKMRIENHINTIDFACKATFSLH